MAQFLNALNATDELPKTIIYSLNPSVNAAIGTVIGCFQDSKAVGKIQQGSAWWFNDHKVGMTNQMTSLANLSLLGNFIGMLTDSRSFLSYTRHEYFRRIMCELIGGWVENGEYPADEKALKKIVDRHMTLKEFTIQAISKGSDDVGKVHMQVEYDNQIYYGFGANTDIIAASVEAYIDCINKFKS